MPPIMHLLCLVPDDSSSSALQQAAVLARTFGATLHLVPAAEMSPQAARALLRDTMSDDAFADLDLRVTAPLDDDRSRVEALQTHVDTIGADLVVTDTPADRGPIPPFADPETRALAEHLDCSLFVAGRRRPLDALQRILVPTDLSDAATTAFETALDFADRYDASVDLVHVVEAIPYVALTPVDRLSLGGSSLPEHRARRRLETFLRRYSETTVSVESHVEYGDPADQISRFVHRQRADLVVFSSRFSLSASTESVADRVLRRVACPILLVRPSGPDAS